MLKNLLHTSATYGTVLGLTAAFAPIVSVVSIKDELYSDPLLKMWCLSVLRAAGVRPDVAGLEEVPPRPCIYVSNHQSHFDAPLIYAHLPGHVRFVAKAELFKIPVFGWALRNTGFIKVDRTGGQQDRQVLAEAVSTVRERTSVLFFAEGTRSEDGTVGSFKKGAVVLALQAGVPIVPLAVAGTRHILRKGSGLIHGGQRAALRVGRPIPTAGLGEGARNDLTQHVREAVLALHREAEAAVSGG